MKSATKFLLFFLFLSYNSYSQIPGTIDQSFSPGSGASDWVYSVDQFSNGKVIIGGAFSTFNGQPFNKLALLLPNGLPDNSFQTGSGPNNTVWTVSKTFDNKIFAGGNFTEFNGKPINRIARLNLNGSLDTTFKPGLGANNWVHIVYPLEDGKVLVGGSFTSFGGNATPYLVKLKVNGTLDSSFQYSPGLNGRVFRIKLTPDGKIMLGGDFTQLGSNNVSKICRLNPNGSIDNSFQIGSGASHEIRGFVFQPDGKIVVGGYALSYNGQNKNRIFRLNANGTLDNTFISPLVNTNPIYSIESQENGKILVSGSFLNYHGSQYSFLVRLNPNGSVDTTFKSGFGPNDGVEFIKISKDGNILVSGNFTSYNGTQIRRVVRLFGDPISTGPGNIIQGSVFKNQNGDCIPNVGESSILYRMIMAEPGPFWGNTLSSGKYSISVDTGTYQVSQVKTSLELLFDNQACPPNNQNQVVQFGSNLGDTIANVNFANTQQNCPILKIDVSANRRRRCFMNHTVISLSNSGNVSATGVKAYLKFPKYVNLVSAQFPYTYNPIDSVYEFFVDTVKAGFVRSIDITDSVSCVSGIMGIEQCTKVWATPKNTCISAPPGWDGVDLEVSGNCSNQVPQFKIKNVGSAMNTERIYSLFSDSALVYMDTLQLGAGDSLVFNVINPQLLVEYRVEVPQSQNHPFSSFAGTSVACDFFPRNSNVFANADEDPIESIHCSEIRDSYDPNDKLVSPKGSTPNGNVLPGRYFDYQIRFQNTGNDTAYKVVVIDTLDSDFDMSTFEQGSSSHRYTMAISGQLRPIIKWTFNNIMLPDSFVNSLGSNGFINFRIKAKNETPLGTQIENSASIYFDFNDPIKTNTTLNTLHIPTKTNGIIDSVQVITSSKKQRNDVAKNVSIFPNPSSGMVSVQVKGYNHLNIISLDGRIIASRNLVKEQTQLDLSGLKKGFYYFEFDGSLGKEFKKFVLQ